MYISGDRFLNQEWLGFTKPLPQPKKYHSRRFIIPGLFERDYVLPQPMISHSDQPAIKKDFNNAVAEHIREVTAYNVGDPKQNYGDPCISANGENICAALNLGLKRCAANFVPFGTQLYIANYGVCTVTDRMNRRYKNRVDIAMKVTEKDKALQFGLEKLKVIILRSSD